MNANPAPCQRFVLSGIALRLCAALLCCVAAGSSVPADTIVGNGQSAREARTTPEFQAIQLSGSLDLELRQGSPAAVVVHGDANLLPLIETAVDADKVLQLRWQRGVSVRTQLRAWVQVTAPQLHALGSSGSGRIQIDTMKGPRLALSIHGSSDLRAKNLNVDELSLSIAGSGDASLAGRSSRLTVDVSGSGNVDAGELESNDATVGIAGSGDVTVHADRKLTASIAGSGDVRYSGNAAVQRAVAGSGSVRKR
jgi:Putative auto-transporter adhesin, head GIN domain